MMPAIESIAKIMSSVMHLTETFLHRMKLLYVCA